MGKVAFEVLDEPPRLHVADTVGNEQYTLYLDEPVSPAPVSTDGFEYPVSDAIRVETTGFELGSIVRLHLWNPDGELLHVIEHDDAVDVPPGEYYLELCLPVKSYLRFSGAASLETNVDGSRVEFDEAVAVDIGARSPRKQPAHTITTTRAFPDVVEAFSYLGEGLMTTTPSRSYPTLRGYPPEIEIGDGLDVPDGLETGPQPVTLAFPAELEFLYEASSLIYYLNADVQPATEPQVLVDGEAIYEFEREAFTSAAEELLRHVFVLDCVTRSVGSYPIETVEASRLVDAIPYDLSELFQADPAARLRMYLQVPFEPVARQAPQWSMVAHVEPILDSVDTIPHVVAQLAPIRAVSLERVSGTEARRAALSAFIDDGPLTRASSEVFEGEASFVDVASSESSTDVWVGPDIPIYANKLAVEGFRNRFAKGASDGTSIEVTIVCNEGWMEGEATSVQNYYGERDDLPFEVTIHEQLDRASLSELLETETDFFHYIGHADAAGLECRDGYLDVSTVPSIGVETFFLNACQSYRQATKLVEGGAIGGIATLSDVTDDQAAIVGRTAARLLNLGFPLRKALEIARSRSVVGGQYLAVGDDSVALVPADSVPNTIVVEHNDGNPGEYEVRIRTYSTSINTSGGMFSPWPDFEDRRYLLDRSIGPFALSTEDLVTYLELENTLVEFDGEFRWAFDLAEELS